MAAVHLLILALSITGAAPEPAASKEMDNAHDTYLEKFAKVSEGVYPQSGLLFVVVEVRHADALTADTLQARSMLRSAALLRKFAREGQTPEHRRTDGAVLLDKYPLVRQACRDAEPSFGESNFHFRVKSRLMEEAKSGEVYRYAIALDRAAFQRELGDNFGESPSVSDVATCLKKRFTQLKRENVRDLIALWLRLGGVEEALRAANDSSRRSYELVSYAVPTRDTLELYAGWLDASRVLSFRTARVTDIAAVLEQTPGFPPALRWLADDYTESKRFAAAANLRLLSLIDGDEPGKNVKQVGEILQKWGRSIPSSAPVLDEYQHLIESLAKEQMPSLGSDNDKAVRFMTRVWRTFGHVNFPTAEASAVGDGNPSTLATAVEEIKSSAAQQAKAMAEKPQQAATWIGIAAGVVCR